MEMRSNRTLGLAVLEHRVKHRAEHHDTDAQADPEHHVHQEAFLLGDRRHRILEIHAQHLRAAWQTFHRSMRRAHGAQRQSGRCESDLVHHVHVTPL
ncbi:hypothetical protein GALL_427140 [mine drainage metagenome]|uniref:Uncharacterized protein n=1 Tax=mine drainage metagenome TaxID=410659 RepID=A0A1J5PVL2_9ZZZZ